MLRVGLTGGLASGKSTVAELLRQHGFRVLDADKVARQMLEPGTPTYQQVVAEFGAEILSGGDGSAIDRTKLAALAFSGQKPRVAALNAILHPAIIAEQQRWMEQVRSDDPHAIAVIEAALIYEAGTDSRFDKMVVVTAPERARIERFIERMMRHDEAASAAEIEAEARRRIAAQMPEEEKVLRADFVIENSGSKAELAAKVEDLARTLRALEQASSG